MNIGFLQDDLTTSYLESNYSVIIRGKLDKARKMRWSMPCFSCVCKVRTDFPLCEKPSKSFVFTRLVLDNAGLQSINTIVEALEPTLSQMADRFVYIADNPSVCFEALSSWVRSPRSYVEHNYYKVRLGGNTCLSPKYPPMLASDFWLLCITGLTQSPSLFMSWLFLCDSSISFIMRVPSIHS